MDRFLLQLMPALRMFFYSEQPPVARFLGDASYLSIAAGKKSYEKWQKDHSATISCFIDKPEDTENVMNLLRKNFQHPDTEALRCGIFVFLRNRGAVIVADHSGTIETILNGSKDLKMKGASGRLSGKIVVVTGGARGLGKGISEKTLKEGANVIVADMNEQHGSVLEKEYAQKYGPNKLIYLKCDVTRVDSVTAMLTEVLRTFGGVDVFISNAGILKAGGLEELAVEDFEFVTDVNYKGFYICTRMVSQIMKAQSAARPGYFSDIIQVNSKSGLQGSNRNFAYAGSKFGSIGLVQSFALELVEHGIKVNAVCPGNYFDGPLWSNPDNGLFVQYLKAGKVEGARTVDDVKKYYEAKVPMNRGVSIADVMQAIFYCIEQKYETGQALPVTGGQIMLH